MEIAEEFCTHTYEDDYKKPDSHTVMTMLGQIHLNFQLCACLL